MADNRTKKPHNYKWVWGVIWATLISFLAMLTGIPIFTYLFFGLLIVLIVLIFIFWQEAGMPENMDKWW